MTGIACLGDLLKLRAVEDRDRVFLIEPDTRKEISFGELEEKTGAVLAALIRLGFRKGDRALCIFHNGIQAALAFLSITKGGGIAVPVNPASTGREFKMLLDHCGARWILAGDDTAADAAQRIAGLEQAGEPGGLMLYRYAPEAPPGGDDRAYSGKDCGDVALFLYTSGTTGVSKGVMLTHQNLLAECANIQQAHALTKNDKVLCLLPLYHINGLVVTLLTPLFVGFTVVMPPRFSAKSFWPWVQEQQVTWFSAVPTIYSILLSGAIPDPATFPDLRFARSASSALPEAVLREFEERTGTPLIESYGITEGGSQITSNPLPPRRRKAGSVGLPFGNEIRVVQKDGSPAPALVTGEVAVRGANIAWGYYQNGEAAKESFRDGWFFTGDLGFFDEEGYLFLKGRSKELINRAGEMISPREIDEILYQIPGVELAAAVGVPHPLYGEEVVAFLQIRQGAYLTEETVRQFCAERLISFKVPKQIFYIDDFPRGPSGKIQRLKLAARYAALSGAAPYEIHLDASGCKACGYCQMVCPRGVFSRGEALNSRGYRFFRPANPGNCTGCMRCFFACPDFCLEVKKAAKEQTG
jgi:acyl-CoA synthetase (AMP-forming)/AMP-acid ligase II/NAD-dependent dihydropyrimidine dehydrogenase PreA subunit